jgi:hypothetical protein
LIRGETFLGLVADKLDQLALNYDDMQWWVSDKGLNVAILPPEAERLRPFDELAGRLTAELWTDGLPQAALCNIANTLDEAGLKVEEELEPAQWKPIADFNRKFSRKAIKTFSQAVQDKRFVRSVLRRLYRARERYVQALPKKGHSRLID